MFNKRKFNKKEGETRECTKCKASFHTMKPRWVCKACVNASSRLQRNIAAGNDATDAYSDRVGRKKSDLEGIGYEERRRNFVQKAKWLDKEVNERSEWQAFFKSELQRIRNDKKLWDSLTRDTLGKSPKKSEIQEGIGAGRPAGVNNKKYKYPNTKGMTWEEYEALGLGEPEDS